MTFFDPTRIPPSQIQLDADAVSSSSPAVQQRMDRIVENYRRLDEMLAEVEAKIQGDERLKAIDETIVEIEMRVDGRKKKWRPRRKSSKSAKSANPKKPR